MVATAMARPEAKVVKWEDGVRSRPRSLRCVAPTHPARRGVPRAGTIILTGLLPQSSSNMADAKAYRCTRVPRAEMTVARLPATPTLRRSICGRLRGRERLEH